MVTTELEELVGTLVTRSGIAPGEVRRMVEEKKESLGHLVNDDVALRLVAKDLGINFNESKIDKPVVKIEDLIPGINNVSLKVKVNRTCPIKEFSKKDGSKGKIAKVNVSDDTGSVYLVLWDDKTNDLHNMRGGCYLTVFSAYTREGLNGSLEVHVGNKARIELTEVPESEASKDFFRGIVCRIYDPITFTRKDGSSGNAVSFILRNDKDIKVLVWNPSEDFLSKLSEGNLIEIQGGMIKNGLYGEPELHVNNEAVIKLRQMGSKPLKPEATRLSELQPNMSDIIIEGIVESEFDIETTFSGKNYAKLLLRDGETLLPITFWNEKALSIKRIAKPGSILRIEGCSTKIGPYGLEMSVNKWSRIKAK